MITSIRNNDIKISVKSLGAELTSFKTTKGDKELLWQGDSRYWKGQSTILFPIIGGIPDGKYVLDGKAYEMNAHGFARNMDFELVEKTQSELVYKLGYTDETLKQYPYKFEFFVSYKIRDNVLIHGFRVNNLDEKEMLFSVGGHPGVFCPLNENEKMEDYRLVFEKPERLNQRIKGKALLTGEEKVFLDGEREKPLAHSLFHNGAMIINGFESDWLEIRNSRNNIVLRFEFAGFPYLGIWSAANDAPFICIEPWYGVDSTEGDSHDFTLKEGLQKLKPGSSFQCEYSISCMII